MTLRRLLMTIAAIAGTVAVNASPAGPSPGAPGPLAAGAAALAPPSMRLLLAQAAPRADLMQEARRAAADGELARAEALLRQVVSLAPDDLEARFLYARVLSWRRDFPAAHRELDQLLERSPENVDYLLAKSQAFLWGGQPRRALPLLERARALAPGYFDVWRTEVQALMATGVAQDREQARALVGRASRHLPQEQASQLAAMASPATQRTRFTDVALGVGYEHLDNDRDPWSALELDLSHRFPGGTTVYGAARAFKRFDEEDQQLVAGIYHPVAEGWMAQVEASVSPAPAVVPRWSLYGRVARELGDGWNLAVAFRRSQYRDPQVDIGNVTLERYWSVFRAAYSLYASSVEGESPVYSHAADLDYYYDDSSYVGASGGRGKEAEFIDETRLEVRRTNFLAFRGRHWLDPQRALEYALNRSHVGGAFTRYGVRLGFRYRY